MFLLDDRVITSASDLTAASKCEFAFLRRLDAKLGRAAAVPDDADDMLERTARLGDAHEERVLQRYRDRFGGGVREVPRPNPLDPVDLANSVDLTAKAFADGADVVFQATFFDGDFLGFADFITRQPGGLYRVQDTKLARTARVTALLQLAAYVEQLHAIGVEADGEVELLLGDGSVSTHRVADILPVYRRRRARLLGIIAEHRAADGRVEWADPRYSVCGHCGVCAAEIEANRDVLLVAGMRVTQHDSLRAAGITTIDELGAAGLDLDRVAAESGIARLTLEGMHDQARLQLAAPDPSDHDAPPFEVRDPAALGAIPAPDAGDLFFDFEGDPLYTEGAGTIWGLDYLFGVLDTASEFTAIWAHSFTEERDALTRFLDLVEARRAAHPAMHIYHYASYERTHLLSIAARHGVAETRVDQLLRDGVLIDLYPVVRHALRVGSHSYSIKKLEPLYMGDDERTGVANAADSITEYVRAREADATGHPARAAGILDDIARYNRYDVLSTLRLRDWLIGLADEAHVAPAAPAPEGEVYEPNPLAARLARLGAELEAQHPHAEERSADATALALASAAIDYFPRERKSFWWGHFARLEQPVEEWQDNRDVLLVDTGASSVAHDWNLPTGKRVERRILQLRGRLAPGSRLSTGQMMALYDSDSDVDDASAVVGRRIVRPVSVLEILDDGVLVEETHPKATAAHAALPTALAPSAPPPTAALEAAIAEWGERVAEARPGWLRDPMLDILRRQPPRTRRGELTAVVGDDRIPALVASLVDLEDSYLAVQGPPGTGKTYLATRVITALVQRHRWKIGVVAQSHAVVENVLDGLEAAGLDPALVAKARKSDDVTPHSYTQLEKKDEIPAFVSNHEESGFVIGGTGWDFANTKYLERRSLDLLVVDEAGQYSLAYTIAAGAAARNVLLLGDPQQLPQVSQGTHPEPIDTSALGWVADGHDVLPANLGYFLAESRRMHPAVADPVSRLSYEGALRSHPSAAERLLDGVAPGLHLAPVVHSGNATESTEEAEAIVGIVRSHLGAAWHESPSAPARPLGQDDVIVVTPYNAQLACVKEALDAAGLDEVRVGTVDKFQGQEAVIAVVSLAASSAADVPRGMEFLIMKNRLNVAISRAQWAAYLVHSPALTEYLPTSPAGVAELSAFITLLDDAAAADAQAVADIVEA